MERGMEENFARSWVEEKGWRKGPWTAEEDRLLIQHVKLHGEGRWTSVAKLAGLKRNGKSCRLRWVNYLRPDLKRGKITPTEESIIIEMHAIWGNRWSVIARSLPGRTDNEIKNYWRTHFKKKGKTHTGNSEDPKTRLLRLQEFHHNLQQQQLPLPQAQEADMERIMSMLDENGSRAQNLPQIKLDSAGFICHANSTDEMSLLYSMMNNNYATEPEAIPEETTDGIIWDALWNVDDVNGNINYSISMNRGLPLLTSATPTY